MSIANNHFEQKNSTSTFLSRQTRFFKPLAALFLFSVAVAFYLALQNLQLKEQILMLQQQEAPPTNQQRVKKTFEEHYDIDRFTPCKYYRDELKDRYFPTYIVKQGDSLLSIARKQLGDSSKYKLLIWYNNKKYPHLTEDLKNSLLEPRWELVLPPPEAPEDRMLQVVSGHVMENIDGSNWGIVGENYYALGYDFEDLKYDSGEIPQIGDCATIVSDGNLNIFQFELQEID